MALNQLPIITNAAGTGGNTSSAIDVGFGSRGYAVRTFGVADLAGGETATVQYQDNAGTYHDLTVRGDDGTIHPVTCTATNAVCFIRQAGTYRIVLSATVGSVGVEILPL